MFIVPPQAFPTMSGTFHDCAIRRRDRDEMAYALPYPGPREGYYGPKGRSSPSTNWAHWAQVPRLPRTSEDKPPAEETRASPPNPPSSSADLDLTLTGGCAVSSCATGA